MNEQGGKSYVTGTRDIHDDSRDKFIATVAKKKSRQSRKIYRDSREKFIATIAKNLSRQ